MANPFFKFKQFTVHHDKCAMKVGTDGVLLGAWTQVDPFVNCLDIGTGTGLVALMLAQRSTLLYIDAIDIDTDAYRQAVENIQLSPFSQQIEVHHVSLNTFASLTSKRYDLIVSNPPYFSQALKAPEQKRNLARHDDSLPLDSLIADSKKLLTEEGRLSLILPSDKEEVLLSTTEAHGLYPVRKTDVYPTLDSQHPKRILIELSPTPVSSPHCDKLVIEIERHRYTPEYIALTQSFYLNM